MLQPQERTHTHALSRTCADQAKRYVVLDLQWRPETETILVLGIDLCLSLSNKAQARRRLQQQGTYIRCLVKVVEDGHLGRQHTNGVESNGDASA